MARKAGTSLEVEAMMQGTWNSDGEEGSRLALEAEHGKRGGGG